MDDPIDVVNQMADAVMAGDFTTALALIDPEAVDHSPLPGAPSGHDGWVRKWASMGETAGELRISVASRIATGDTVASRYDIRAASTGDLLGFALDVLRVEDGKIVEHWALPLPGAPAG